MTAETPVTSPLGRPERLLLAAVALVLSVALVLLRGGLHPGAPLERLARQSLDLPVALSDGRPTLVEFYADWCEACREKRGQLDVVLLNVDNPRWEPELERYAVNGIPQLELFNQRGDDIGRSLGARTAAELSSLSSALIAETPLPVLPGVGSLSDLRTAGGSLASGGPSPASPAPVGPRSHG
jgi:thiol-disulfide isomerase/thioredoxin